MAETAAPSLQRSGRPFKPSAILQFCQSPWNGPTQISLNYARGAIAAYLTPIIQFILVISLFHTQEANLVLFYGSYLSFMWQVIYYWIKFWWTLKGHERPRNHNAVRQQSKSGKPADKKSLCVIPPSRGGLPTGFSIFNAVIVRAPFVVMYVMFGQRSLSSSLNYIPGLVAFHMNVAIGVFGMIEVLVRSCRSRQQSGVIECLLTLLAGSYFLLWIGVRLLSTGKLVFQAFPPESEDWTILFRVGNSLLTVNSIILVLQLYLHHIEERLNSMAEFQAPRQAALVESADEAGFVGTDQDGDWLET